MLKQKGLKNEIKFAMVTKDENGYKILDCDKDANVLGEKRVEDLLEDFVDLGLVNIKIEYIDKKEI